MKILYANKKIERYCTSLKEASKLFGGDKKLALSLLSRINAFEPCHIDEIARMVRIVEIVEVSAHYE